MNTNSMNRASVIGNNKVKYCFHIAVSIRELGGTSAWWRIVASKATSPSSSRCLMIATVWSPFGVPALRDNHRYWSAEARPLIDMGSSTQEWLYVNEKIATCQAEPYHTTEQIRRGEWIANSPFTLGDLYEPLSYCQRLRSYENE